MSDDLVNRTLAGLLTGQHEMGGQAKIMSEQLTTVAEKMQIIAGQMQSMAGQMQSLAVSSDKQEERLLELVGVMKGFAEGQAQVRQEQSSIRTILEEYGRRLDALEKKDD